MKKLFVFFVFGLSLFSSSAQRMSLAGEWKVRLGSPDSAAHCINLPGTLDDAGIGEAIHITPSLTIATLAHLQRKVQYVGKAFYTRSVFIPTSWKNGNIHLHLGRVLWRSTVRIDGKPVPLHQESLTTSHSFDISDHVTAGRRNEIEICVDNSNIYPGINIYASQYPSMESREMVHAYTNHTQIKWNGILGDISISRKQKIHLKQVVITPDSKTHQLRLKYFLQNESKSKISVESYVIDPATNKKWENGVKQSGLQADEFAADLPIPKNAIVWSEFSPRIYRLMTITQSEFGKDTLITSFGVRELLAQNGDLFLNGNRLFMRANLECVIFPLKGYPPMKTEEWEQLFTKAKGYGLNSFRFHSWCPPEAAFEAADRTGFYLQLELPHWNLKAGEDMTAFGFLKAEAEKILDAYGNHPSFLFFSLGNELEGDFQKLNSLVAELKAKDKRHLYSITTFTFQKEITGAPQPEDDFYVTQWTKKGWVRGQGVFNSESPDFSKDYNQSIQDINVPLISHEIGQYSVYPDLNEIKAYTGNLVPLNFIAVKNDLTKKGLAHLAPSFLAASGKLATLLYKEEIERAMKTKGMDGFQLLQLQDFPGQGTALVGLLNSFWKSKGFITARQFYSFCSEVTPLMRFPKAVYSNNETFEATVELSNFYKTLRGITISWTIKNNRGSILSSGSFAPTDYVIGNCLLVGKMQYSLKNITSAQQITVEISVEGTAYHNEWKVWVYPTGLTLPEGNVVVTSSSADALAALDSGQKVLLCPPADTLEGIDGKFVPVFWSPVHFPDQPGTMGLLINNKHKALASFPTDTYTDWQWWDLTIKSKSLDAGSLPDKAIIVRVIDNFVRNKSLTNLFEAKLGKGQLIFCSIDIVSDLNNRPQAKQLRYSLLKYMNSKDFNPRASITKEQLSGYFK